MNCILIFISIRTHKISTQFAPRFVALGCKRFHALAQFRNRFAELVSVSYKFGIRFVFHR